MNDIKRNDIEALAKLGLQFDQPWMVVDHHTQLQLIVALTE
jgi:hypothetical protein